MKCELCGKEYDKEKAFIGYVGGMWMFECDSCGRIISLPTDVYNRIK